jgi:hypothetical protein
VIESSESIKVLLDQIDELDDKFMLIKQFLLEYDENFKQNYENKILLNSKSKKPSSWLNNNRFNPYISTSLIINTLDYLNVTDYYQNCIKSNQSVLVKYALEKTITLPK